MAEEKKNEYPAAGKVPSVCPAGGEHVKLDRRGEIDAQGIWVPVQISILGKVGVAVQTWWSCAKCSGVFMAEDRLDPIPAINAGTDGRKA